MFDMRDSQVGAELQVARVESSAVTLSFEEFFQAEHERLLGALYVVVGNRSDAEELMQEAFLRVWERWARVQILESPIGYLYRTAMNTSRTRGRRAAIAARRVLGIANPRDDFSDVEVREDVRVALAALTLRQRAALVLTDLLGHSSVEAGRILGIKDSTVRALATQARASLRQTLESPDE